MLRHAAAVSGKRLSTEGAMTMTTGPRDSLPLQILIAFACFVIGLAFLHFVMTGGGI